MSIFENTVMVSQKVSTARKAAVCACAGLTVAALVAAIILNPYLFMIPALLFAVLWYFVRKFGEIEYEYTYIDGELDIDRIRSKSRRKGVASIDMEDLLMIAPQGSGELNNSYRDDSAAKKDCSSRTADAKKYDVVFKSGKGISIITFEPDQNMLDMIRIKNARKVIL